MTSNQNELEHYGVLGMRWGVRKDPDRAYEKAGAKLAKLDKKSSITQLKGAAREQVASKKQRRASSAMLFQKTKAKAASRATRRALKNYQRAQELQVKAYRWNEQMKKAFANTKVSNLNPDYVDLGEKYSKMTLDSIMKQNVSVNSLMNIDDYYRRMSR